ncbi:MAG: hypothetical protein QXT38_03540 [Candidatus Aenigmatarchaeota archaeon]
MTPISFKYLNLFFKKTSKNSGSKRRKEEKEIDFLKIKEEIIKE